MWYGKFFGVTGPMSLFIRNILPQLSGFDMSVLNEHRIQCYEFLNSLKGTVNIEDKEKLKAKYGFKNIGKLTRALERKEFSAEDIERIKTKYKLISEKDIKAKCDTELASLLEDENAMPKILAKTQVINGERVDFTEEEYAIMSYFYRNKDFFNVTILNNVTVSELLDVSIFKLNQSKYTKIHVLNRYKNLLQDEHLKIATRLLIVRNIIEKCNLILNTSSKGATTEKASDTYDSSNENVLKIKEDILKAFASQDTSSKSFISETDISPLLMLYENIRSLNFLTFNHLFKIDIGADEASELGIKKPDLDGKFRKPLTLSDDDYYKIGLKFGELGFRGFSPYTKDLFENYIKNYEISGSINVEKPNDDTRNLIKMIREDAQSLEWRLSKWDD